MAESFPDRLRRYLRETNQRYESLAVKIDVPPQVLRRCLFVEDDSEPPQYLLDRLTKVTGINWGGTSASNESFVRAMPAGDEFKKSFFNSTPRSAERPENPFKEPADMSASKSKDVSDSRQKLEELFKSSTSSSAPETDARSEQRTAPAENVSRRRRGGYSEEELQNFHEHINLGLGLFRSAEAFGRAVGTTGTAVRNWRGKHMAGSEYLSDIARVLEISVSELFEAPSAAFRERCEQARDIRDTRREKRRSLPSSIRRHDEQVAAAAARREAVAAEAAAEAARMDEDRVPSAIELAESIFNTQVPAKPLTPPPVPEPEVAAPAPVQAPSPAAVEEEEADEPQPTSHMPAAMQPSFGVEVPPPPVVMPEEVPEAKAEENSEMKAEEAPAEAPKEVPQFQFGGDIADLIPDGSLSQTVLSDRITAYMNTHEVSIGEMTLGMPRREKDIYRLQNLILGRATPKPREAALLRKLLEIDDEQLTIEGVLPSRRVREMPAFERIAAKNGLMLIPEGGVPAVPAAPAVAEAPVTEAPAPVEPEPVEETPVETPAPAAPVLPEGISRLQAEFTDGRRVRGISAIEYGSGLLDFAVGGAEAQIFVVPGREYEPDFKAETAVVIATEGFDPAEPVSIARLPKAAWYLVMKDGRRVLSKLDPIDAEGEETAEVIGIAVAAIRTKLL